MLHERRKECPEWYLANHEGDNYKKLNPIDHLQEAASIWQRREEQVDQSGLDRSIIHASCQKDKLLPSQGQKRNLEPWKIS